MSTKLKIKEPDNFLMYTTHEDCLTAEYMETKTRVDKKTTVIEYHALWTLSGIVDDRPTFIGHLKTPVEASTKAEAEERIDFLSDYVAAVIKQAHKTKTADILEDVIKGREIIAAVHARHLSIFLHGEDFEKVANLLRNLIIQFGVKNVKKVLSSVVDAKVDSA